MDVLFGVLSCHPPWFAMQITIPRDVRYKAERYGQKTGKVGFCWDVGSDVVGFVCWVLDLEKTYVIPHEMHVFDIQFGLGLTLFVSKKDRSIWSIPIDAKWGNMKEISYRFHSNFDGWLSMLDTQSVN